MLKVGYLTVTKNSFDLFEIWQRKLDMSSDLSRRNDSEKCIALKVDEEDIVYVLGSTKGSLDSEAVEKRDGKDDRDLFVAKIDHLGSLIWINQLTSATMPSPTIADTRDFYQDETAIDLYISPDKNIHVLGSTHGYLGDERMLIENTDDPIFFPSDTMGLVIIKVFPQTFYGS